MCVCVCVERVEEEELKTSKRMFAMVQVRGMRDQPRPNIGHAHTGLQKDFIPSQIILRGAESFTQMCDERKLPAEIMCHTICAIVALFAWKREMPETEESKHEYDSNESPSE